MTVRALVSGSVSPAEADLKRLDQTNRKLVLNSLNWNKKEIQVHHMALRKKTEFSKHRPFGPMLSISRFVRTYVCLFTFEVPFNGLFAPTSRSRMSNIFRDSESLGKSNGKKWSDI